MFQMVDVSAEFEHLAQGYRVYVVDQVGRARSGADPQIYGPLANAGHDTRALQAWLGHKNIQHTVRYTELAPDRFKNFWRD
jgi:alpha-beta hydrolase superfamily lysophospholipase